MQDQRKRIVIVGATSSIAEHCARTWATEPGAELTLVVRNREKAERIAADLQVRGPRAAVRIVESEFADPAAIRQLADTIAADGPLDTVLIAHGSLPDQELCQQDLAASTEALIVNGISPVLFAEAFAGHMANANRGTLGIIGSVAGDRGRKSNYVYGAAKGMVTRYAQGLQHRMALSGRNGVKVVLIKPGPTATPMTAHMTAQAGKMARVEDVAKCIVDGMRAGKPVVYAPGKWAVIMMVIRHLPSVVFNKMDI
ncbi:SDR family NAD(P)-dependent oxidoreductase [Cupriavidus pinatubonensis]|uniref:SDR family NAD(P)-dependent oxidoreductase n=1 Tax=Cupriavidus pinatubonensis TaxID=248026 RepID=UPI001C73A91C|nr:SDR family NAD(P)-dependent oxidoreductase [Cupriavidus pinatubonensis]QYY32319.1 SDR family NAD(P)-dependent oxidoreductase [Cupriavidus pinatubonensis]